MIKKIFKDGKWELSPYPNYLGQPLFATTSPLEGQTIISYDSEVENALIIMRSGEMQKFGDIEKIASAVLQYFIKEGASDGITAIVVNDALKCHFGDTDLHIEFVGTVRKPDFFDELATMVHRFSELGAFS